MPRKEPRRRRVSADRRRKPKMVDVEPAAEPVGLRTRRRCCRRTSCRAHFRAVQPNPRSPSLPLNLPETAADPVIAEPAAEPAESAADPVIAEPVAEPVAEPASEPVPGQPTRQNGPQTPPQEGGGRKQGALCLLRAVAFLIRFEATGQGPSGSAESCFTITRNRKPET